MTAPEAFLLLRLEAPLMAFGGPVVDHNGITGPCPGLAQLTGLLANALGWDHRDGTRLERLQSRLGFASAVLRAGSSLVDFQTVDLGQHHLIDTGWTTRGTREDRGKGDATRSTHIRYRHYRADGAVLVALRLAVPDESPTLDDLARALDEPERPLFIGRKSCLPTMPLMLGRAEVSNVVDALHKAIAQADALVALGTAPRHQRRGSGPVRAEWPVDTPRAVAGVCHDRRVDRRDWRNQVHGGERLVAVGVLPEPGKGELTL